MMGRGFMHGLRYWALALLAFVFLTVPAFSDPAPSTGSISGVVVDANSALALGGAMVTAIGPSNGTATTSPNGHFRIDGLTAGSYSLRIQLPGYQTTLSDQIPITSGMTQDVTLSLLRVTGGESVRTLGRTTIHASSSM